MSWFVIGALEEGVDIAYVSLWEGFLAITAHLGSGKQLLPLTRRASLEPTTLESLRCGNGFSE